MNRIVPWHPCLRALSVAAALLPVLVAATMGLRAQLPGLALGVFVNTLVAFWFPRAWKVFWLLVVVNVLAACSFSVSAHLESQVWLAAAFLVVIGCVSGVLTKRFNPLVSTVLTTGAACGLNVPAAIANTSALAFISGAIWSIACVLSTSRPPEAATSPKKVQVPVPRFYPLRCGLSLGVALIAGHWIWTSYPGWAPVATAAVLRPDLALSGHRSLRRLMATLGGILLSSALLALHLPGFVSFLFLVMLLSGALLLKFDQAWVIPLVTTTLVLTILGHTHPEQLRAVFSHRVEVNLLGAAIAWLFLRMPPTGLRERKLVTANS